VSLGLPFFVPRGLPFGQPDFFFLGVTVAVAIVAVGGVSSFEDAFPILNDDNDAPILLMYCKLRIRT